MKKVALVPGSFDPITIAHVDIIERSLPLFDEVVIGIGVNSNKVSFLSIEDREEMVKQVFAHQPKVKIVAYEGLTAAYCKSIGAKYMLRGIRSVADFEYEKAIAQINGVLTPDIETVFMLSKPEYSSISSTIVRDILRNEGDASPFVPSQVVPFINK